MKTKLEEFYEELDKADLFLWFEDEANPTESVVVISDGTGGGSRQLFEGTLSDAVTFLRELNSKENQNES